MILIMSSKYYSIFSTLETPHRKRDLTMSLSTTDVPLADATATATGAGEEDLSPVLDNVEECGADAEEAVAAAASGVTFEVEEGGGEGDNNNSGNDDANPRQFVSWESRGTSYQFAKNPIRACVWIILVLRAVHFGLVVGTNLINPGFLTGKTYISRRSSHKYYVFPQISSSSLLTPSYFYIDLSFTQVPTTPVGIQGLAQARLIPSLRAPKVSVIQCHSLSHLWQTS